MVRIITSGLGQLLLVLILVVLSGSGCQYGIRSRSNPHSSTSTWYNPICAPPLNKYSIVTLQPDQPSLNKTLQHFKLELEQSTCTPPPTSSRTNPHVNNNIAKFPEALFVADRHAREEVRQRSLMQQKLAQKEKESKEENLRLLAQHSQKNVVALLPN